MVKRVWVCESCDCYHEALRNIWLCPGCDEETCESCFGRFGHCRECSEADGVTDVELMRQANSAGFGFQEGE